MAAAAQEFHISVTPLGTQDEYLVRIERVAPGVLLAEERVIWPVEDWLAQARQLMNDPLFLLLQGQQGYANNLDNNLAANSPINLVTLGEQLYNALFQGSIRDSWMMAQAIAQNQRSILRLRLGLKGTYLPRLPWEVLHAGDRPLATGADVTFSRYQLSTTSSRTSIPTSSQNQAVKILMVISGPTDQETLALKQEAYHLQEELKIRSNQSSLPIQLKILEQPGREQITQALEHNHYQVFHYAGHSNLGAAGGDLYLVSGKTGLTETLSGDDLAGLLVNNGIQLAVFNSCRGADTATSTDVEGREQNLAYALVKRGIPSVLAMAERIPDEVALTLTSLFYRNLNRGYPIDLSLSRARQGLISAYGSNQLYWALPVLYLHPQFDGFLATNTDSKELAQRLTVPDPAETLFVAEEIESREIKNSSHRPSPYDPEADFDEAIGIEEEWIDDEDEQDLIASGRSHASFVSYDRFDDEDDDSDLLDDIDYDISYEEDSAVVADLFRHIAQNDTAIKQPVEQTESALVSQSQKVNSQAEGATKLSSLTTPQATTTPQLLSIETPVNPQSPPQQPPKIHWQVEKKDKRKRILLPLLGATSIIAIAVSGFWYWQNRSITIPELPPDFNQSASVPQVPNLSKADLKAAKTAAVTTIAIEQFSQNNLISGQQAVEELLDRNALNQAKGALANVPKKDLDSATISFLRGRLAWQSVQAGDKEYSIDDARRYWEFALKSEPNSTLYRNALGFAYYTEGKFEQANEVWFNALYLSPKNQGEIASKDTLTTYAALAIGLKQLAKTQPSDKQAKLLNESTKLRQKVMSDDPVNFQPDALSNNWLWSEKAIQDWRSLLQSQS